MNCIFWELEFSWLRMDILIFSQRAHSDQHRAH